MLIIKIIWWFSVFIIFEAMIGYPLSLVALDKVIKRKNKKDYLYEPTVSVMVAAHNEEKVIEKKLNNLLELDYPHEKLDFLIASDFSTDGTNEIVEQFIKSHPERKIQIHKSKSHLGKTNAQDETQELCDSEILVMTDANAMMEKESVRELVASFSSDDIAYVTGQLKYINSTSNVTAGSEGFYWKLDLMCRNIESNIQTITAGNGSIYAVRNREYIKIEPIKSHDLFFPHIYALKKKRAIYNPEAVAYEKAGETVGDEFKRKVRMSRGVLSSILPSLEILNIFRYRWYSYFYFGHRSCRYLLWLSHCLLLISNAFLLGGGWFWRLAFAVQLLFYCIAIIGWTSKSKNRVFRMAAYYCMTIIAQWYGVYNILTGKAKPVWEKAETTR